MHRHVVASNRRCEEGFYSVLALLVGLQEEQPVCKNLSDEVLVCYLSGAMF